MMKKFWFALLTGCCVLAMPVLGEIVIEEIIDVPVVEDPAKAAETPGEEPVTDEPEVKQDKLNFINGDRLQGLLVSVDPKKNILTWQSQYSVKPIELDLACADKLELKSRDSEQRKWGTASIHLSNNDELWGDIVSLDKDAMTLKTWYSGTMKIRRPMIARIKVQNRDSSVLYEGPNSMSEWTVGRQGRGKSWEYKKGALYALQQSPIARKIENMPAKVKVDFDMAWRGSYPGMAISLFNNNLTRQSDCYTITISGSSIYLYRYSQNSGSSHLGNAELSALTSGASPGGRFTILADRKEKTVALMFNGVMVRQWSDKAGAELSGDVLMFYPQTQNSTKLSNIKVSEWDGQIPQAGVETKEKSSEDLIRLGNGDKVSGQIQSIAGDTLKFKASYAEMEIPLSRIVEIVCAEEKLEKARRNACDVRFTLANGGTMTFDLKGLQADEASGETENLGSVKLPLNAVKQIEYNLYTEKPAESDFDF